MTKATRIISLNLGSQTIGLAEFQAQPQGGLVLQNYRLREVLIDPASEEIRHPQISAALREMMAELQIRHQAVNYAVSAQSVFARFVKLPAVEEEKVERITAAIAKEFNESFAAAEFRKKRDGLVGLGGAYAEPTDPELARVSKLIRSTMTRLHAEVMRSISHYRAQQQGNTPERVFLCGETASAPYMREFFREKLQIPIEFFNPLCNVAVAHSAPVKELTPSAHLLGELEGF